MQGAPMQVDVEQFSSPMEAHPPSPLKLNIPEKSKSGRALPLLPGSENFPTEAPEMSLFNLECQIGYAQSSSQP